MKRALIPLLCFLLLGCNAQNPAGPSSGGTVSFAKNDSSGGGGNGFGHDSGYGSGNGSGGGNGGDVGGSDGANEPIDGHYIFSVSASAVDPSVNSATAPDAPFELYVWLLESNAGLAAFECDIHTEGVALAEEYYRAEDPHLFITWEGSGEIDMAVAGCPTSPTLLGAIRVESVSGPVHVEIEPGAAGGAVDCTAFPTLHEFECIPFRSE